MKIIPLYIPLVMLCLLALFSSCDSEQAPVSSAATVQTESTQPSTTAPVETQVPAEPETEPTAPEQEETEPTQPYVVSTASVGVTGDVLIHKPIMTASAYDSGYDFSGIYSYVSEYFSAYDLMIANLETTLGGSEAGPYQGYPKFNCPDEIVDALLEAGVDMMLTANNHTYDTGINGMKRTLQVLQDKGMDYLGTRASEDEVFYTVQQINGISIGMVCYTYETDSLYEGQKALNGITMTLSASQLVNSFHYGRLDEFYLDVENVLQQMKAEGAQATMLFIHWGDEYSRSPNANQQQIAQQLCELGVDVIVGGHPHVVQPFETLTSSTGHSTYCIYSLGNSISNQRRTLISGARNGHSEDGMIFGVEFEKWSDGSVRISDIHIIPTWVSLEYKQGRNVYRIIPLDSVTSTWSAFDVSSQAELQASYDRTMAIIGPGMEECHDVFGLSRYTGIGRLLYDAMEAIDTAVEKTYNILRYLK